MILRLVRLLSFLMLAVLVSQSTLAFAFPCDAARCADECGDEHDAEGDEHDGEEEGDDHERCPCPIDCGPACGGSALRAVEPALVAFALPRAVVTEIVWSRGERSPPQTEPAEIAHVPRRPS